MRKNVLMAVALMAALLSCCLSCATQACAERQSELIVYSDISFENATPKEIAQILREKGVIEASQEHNDYLITDFGYSWRLRIEYAAKKIGVHRVTLARAGNGFATGTAFVELFQKDILQFLDVERQLVEKYGEPDARYFQSDSYKYNRESMTKYMFPTGLWDKDALENVLDSDKNLIAFSEWNNVFLRLWVNWTDERANGFLTKLDLQYHDAALHAKPITIEEYPREIK